MKMHLEMGGKEKEKKYYQMNASKISGALSLKYGFYYHHIVLKILLTAHCTTRAG